jgi:hypothetical protein
MAARFMSRLGDPGAHLRVALDRDGAGIDGERQLIAAEQPLDPPYAGTRAVFEHRFGGEIAIGGIDRVDHLGQPVITTIPGGMGVFGAFLVIQHQIDRNARTIRPTHARHVPPIADQIALRPGNILICEWP